MSWVAKSQTGRAISRSAAPERPRFVAINRLQKLFGFAQWESRLAFLKNFTGGRALERPAMTSLLRFAAGGLRCPGDAGAGKSA